MGGSEGGGGVLEPPTPAPQPTGAGLLSETPVAGDGVAMGPARGGGLGGLWGCCLCAAGEES